VWYIPDYQHQQDSNEPLTIILPCEANVKHLKLWRKHQVTLILQIDDLRSLSSLEDYEGDDPLNIQVEYYDKDMNTWTKSNLQSILLKDILIHLLSKIDIAGKQSDSIEKELNKLLRDRFRRYGIHEQIDQEAFQQIFQQGLQALRQLPTSILEEIDIIVVPEEGDTALLEESSNIKMEEID